MDDKNFIYLDFASTSPIDDSVISYMKKFMGEEGFFANSFSNSYIKGWEVLDKIKEFRVFFS